MRAIIFHRSVSALAAFIGLGLLCSCRSVGPDYEPPEVSVPASFEVMPPSEAGGDIWERHATEGVTDGSARLQRWWTQLRDPELTALIEKAQSSNLDLKMAASRIEQARARLGVAKGFRWPNMGVGASAYWHRLSSNGSLRQIAPASGFEPAPHYGLGVDASWEIDVWGKVRRSIEAAGARESAQVEEYRDLLVTLLADVGTTFVEVRTLQQRLAYARDNVTLQQETLSLASNRFESGVASELDVVQARTSLTATEAVIPAIEIELNFALNRLAVLLGEQPGSLTQQLSPPGPIPTPPLEVATGIPADLLRQRPDVRTAERELAAQVAEIGATKSELYPQFELVGAVGLDSERIGELFDEGSGTWNVGIPIRWLVFDGGKVRERVRVQTAQAKEAMDNYDRIILTATQEVDDALTAFVREQIRHKLLEEAVTTARTSVDLALFQYDAGLTDFQNVLDSQRTLFAHQDQSAASAGQTVNNLITLYKALGGGWSEDDMRTSSSE